MGVRVSEWFVSWLARTLSSNQTFREAVKEICEKHYTTESLKIARVWGDPARLIVGKDVHLNDALVNTVSGSVIIGDYAFLGHGVNLLTGTHQCEARDADRQMKVPISGRDIIIGNGVWIASNATVIGPCEIGENAVIGAASVVTGAVPANTLYAGNPAKFIREV